MIGFRKGRGEVFVADPKVKELGCRSASSSLETCRVFVLFLCFVCNEMLFSLMLLIVIQRCVISQDEAMTNSKYSQD